jgi:hypothetical protein
MFVDWSVFLLRFNSHDFGGLRGFGLEKIGEHCLGQNRSIKFLVVSGKEHKCERRTQYLFNSGRLTSPI